MTPAMMIKFNILSLVCEFEIGEDPLEVAQEMYDWVMEDHETEHKDNISTLRPV